MIIIPTQHYTVGTSQCRQARNNKRLERTISAGHRDNIEYIGQDRKNVRIIFKYLALVLDTQWYIKINVIRNN